MGIPIDIPGLDVIIPEVEDGRTVLVESGADLTNSFLVLRLSRAALRTGHPLTFVTSRDAKEVRESLQSHGAEAAGSPEPRVVEATVMKELASFIPEHGLLAVDSFSFLTIDLEPQALAGMLREVHAALRFRRSTAVLATDRGMFEPRSEAIAIHIADGYIQFHAREGNDGLVRFLRIPKWTNGKFFDRNIYYDFDGKRLAIDLRSRVL